MQYHAVVDRFPLPVPLDPIAAAIFTAAFIATVLAVRQRPAYGIAALTFSAPFAYYHEFFTSITFPKVVLVGMLCGLAVQPRLFRVLAERRVRWIITAGAAIIAAILLSGIHAQYPALVIREAFKWAEYLADIVAVIVAYRADPDDNAIRFAWDAAIAIVCASALIQEVIGAPSGLWIPPGVVPRIAGVLEGPNQLAGYLETAIAVLAAWSITSNARTARALLSIAIVTLLLTFSRAGTFGAAVGLAVLALIYGQRAYAAAAPVFVGAIVGLGADAAWTVAAKTLAFLRVPSIGPDYAGGVGTRSELWRAAIFFFRSHPLLGIGAGNYELELPQAGLYNVRTHSNNWYLQQLAEGGIVLFGATIAFIAAVLSTLLRFARKSPWTAAGLASTLALCAHQLFDYIVFYPKDGVPWMIAIGLGIAASLPSPECVE